MKKLVCEMCGGTELMKREGVFVCESCGTKYSVEEAKKMMIDGTVEVQGAVQVQNAAQVDNLFRLAESSFNSKNFAQAEDFCNQIIAINGNHFEAWKLKGEAINYQISGTVDRIEEVYNCIMTSYNVLDEEGKDEHREEVLESLRNCLEGEIDFVLDLFEQNPSDDRLKRVKESFIECASNVITSYEELGYTAEDADAYRTNIKNYFIKKANKAAETAWDDVIWPNYYRGGFTDEYHPNTAIFKELINDGDNAISLLQFAEEYFTEQTPLEDRRDCYRLQNFFQRKISNGCSYKLMEYTTTNGYGAVTSRREQWEVDKSLTESAKASRGREIERTLKLYDKMDVEIAKKDPQTRTKMVRQWQNELDALDLGLHFGGGWIFAIGLWVVFAICSFTFVVDWCAGFEWLAYIIGVIFTIGAIACFSSAYKNAKAVQEDNEAKAERLEAKIREMSK